MVSKRLTRHLYRELLRKAHTLDKHAALKAAICPSEVADDEFCFDVVTNFFGRRRHYWPESSAVKYVQTLFRSLDGTSQQIDAGLRVLRFLNAKCHAASELGILSIPRLTFPPCPVTLTEKIQRGVFLIAHPLNTRPFEQSVILITRHDTKCTKGVIINDDGDAKQRNVASVTMNPVLTALCGAKPLLYGGPVTPRTIQFLHPYADLGGSLVNAPHNHDGPALFLHHDLTSLTQSTSQRGTVPLQPRDIAFFHGHAAWVPGQLQEELDDGVWIVVEAPLEYALHPPANVWRYLLESLGGEYGALASTPKNVDLYIQDF